MYGRMTGYIKYCYAAKESLARFNNEKHENIALITILILQVHNAFCSFPRTSRLYLWDLRALIFSSALVNSFSFLVQVLLLGVLTEVVYSCFTLHFETILNISKRRANAVVISKSMRYIRTENFDV